MGFPDIPDTVNVAATGTVFATPAMIVSVVLTPAAATATLVLRNGGAGGTTKLTLQALVSGNSAVWMSPYPIRCGTDIHATLAGAGATATVQYLPTT